ncbi:hypothetical protein [Devosia sp. 1566]|uniref:hypothetical protein n=1 Tax=Devosia sp. 1566 TaxID=2499144 RepID=UPI000FDBA145|nr:hypothetical protein [Devosia sp. 1566]
MSDQASNPPPSPAARKAGLIEWILAALSALVILGLASFLLVEALTKTGSHPELTLRLDAVRQTSDGFVADVTVLNLGHATAAEVGIEGTVGSGQDAVSGSVTLDYAPAQSQSPVALVFDRPVTPETLALRVLGYRDP